MQDKHKKVFESVFKKPIPANIEWEQIESLLEALDAEITEGNGSRVRVKLKYITSTGNRSKAVN